VGFPDVLLLKGYCDSVILVTKEGLVPIGLLQHAAKLANSVPGNTLGVVLNMADVRALHSNGYSYSNHYSYHGHDKYYSKDGSSRSGSRSKVKNSSSRI
jgi:Mrp family chromosome partitioning ATPase